MHVDWCRPASSRPHRENHVRAFQNIVHPFHLPITKTINRNRCWASPPQPNHRISLASRLAPKVTQPQNLCQTLTLAQKNKRRTYLAYRQRNRTRGRRSSSVAPTSCCCRPNPRHRRRRRHRHRAWGHRRRRRRRHRGGPGISRINGPVADPAHSRSSGSGSRGRERARLRRAGASGSRPESGGRRRS